MPFCPKAVEECRRIYGERDHLVLGANQKAALDGADALIVATEWNSFKAPDFREMRAALAEKAIFDDRNIYDPQTVAKCGLVVYEGGAGRVRSFAVKATDFMTEQSEVFAPRYSLVLSEGLQRRRYTVCLSCGSSFEFVISSSGIVCVNIWFPYYR